MIAALAYSVVPPVILGRMKLPLARRLQDEVLHTDALMQKADWMTGLAGIAGIVGIGLGYWWADSVAAGIISFSILHDGITSLRIAVAELADGAPRELGSTKLEEEAGALRARLLELYPGADVRLRDSGRFILAQVSGARRRRTRSISTPCGRAGRTAAGASLSSASRRRRRGTARRRR